MWCICVYACGHTVTGVHMGVCVRACGGLRLMLGDAGLPFHLSFFEPGSLAESGAH